MQDNTKVKKQTNNFLPVNNQNNVPGHLCHDISTTRSVRLQLIQNIIISMSTKIFPLLITLNALFGILSQIMRPNWSRVTCKQSHSCVDVQTWPGVPIYLILNHTLGWVLNKLAAMTPTSVHFFITSWQTQTFLCRYHFLCCRHFSDRLCRQRKCNVSPRSVQ